MICTTLRYFFAAFHLLYPIICPIYSLETMELILTFSKRLYQQLFLKCFIKMEDIIMNDMQNSLFNGLWQYARKHVGLRPAVKTKEEEERNTHAQSHSTPHSPLLFPYRQSSKSKSLAVYVLHDRLNTHTWWFFFILYSVYQE